MANNYYMDPIGTPTRRSKRGDERVTITTSVEPGVVPISKQVASTRDDGGGVQVTVNQPSPMAAIKPLQIANDPINQKEMLAVLKSLEAQSVLLTNKLNVLDQRVNIQNQATLIGEVLTAKVTQNGSFLGNDLRTVVN